jgi:hypothetical protein
MIYLILLLNKLLKKVTIKKKSFFLFVLLVYHILGRLSNPITSFFNS